MKDLKVFLVFLIGFAIGITVATLFSDFLRPYFPEVLKPEKEIIEGKVTAKELKRDRLLLTVSAPHGAILITFNKRLSEIDLLIEEDDTITLGLHQYEPFVYTHQEPPLTRTYPGVFDTDWDGEDDQFNRAWLENLLSTVDTFAGTHGVSVAVNEFGVMRWEPGADDFMDDQMDLFEQRGINHALWLWETSWPLFAEEVDAFNFRHGPDPNNHADVESSDLMDVIVEYWGRNTIRP